MALLFTVTDVGLLVTYGGVMMVINAAIIAGALMLLPLRAVDRAIARAERSALERVRAEVAREQEAMLASGLEPPEWGGRFHHSDAIGSRIALT